MMSLKDLIPWRRDKEIMVDRGVDHPLQQLHWGIDHLFDDFIANMGWSGSVVHDVLSPRIDLAETDKEVIVTAEMPGLDENDIDVSLDRNTLMIRGQKTAEKEDKEKHYYHVERAYSTFYRAVPLPCEVDDEHVKATYKKGLLTVHLPKIRGVAQARKRIEIH
jgi:HSP20 family protein